MREAPAQDGGGRLLQVRVAGLRVGVENRLGREHDAVQAEAAVPRLLVDERLLDRMRAFRRAEAFERDDLGAGDGADWRHAGAHGAAANDGRARSALAEAAAELRPAQAEIVAEDVEQWRRWIDVHRM